MRARIGGDAERARSLWAVSRPGSTAVPALAPDPPVWWHLALALGAALAVQGAFAPSLGIRGAPVSFVALLVAWYGTRTGPLAGFVFGVIAGACEDAVAGTTGVAWMVATAAEGWAAGRLARTWLADTRLALVPAAAAAALGRYLVFAAVMAAEKRPVEPAGTHLRAALAGAVLDACVAFAALRLFPRLGGSDAHRR